MSPAEGERTVDPAGRYVLESRLATGGMGEVWRGRDTVLGRPVAVKLLKPEYADDATFRARFETEARHAAALHHPHVAAVFDFGESPAADGSGTPRPYLVMELVDGQPLSALLRPGQPMAPAAATSLLAQAADAIGAAHAAGIVHRDVKPANLLLTRDRQVKITDFGIARAAEGMALTQTGQVMGTPQYFSPEQAQGAPATPASDVYSLGVVAFECLAGRRPFEGPTQVATALAHVREPVPALPGDVPADLALVVRTCLAKDPGDRFPDGAALAAALRDPATATTAVLAAQHGAGDDLTRVAPAALATPAPTPAAGTPVAAPTTGRDAPGSRRTRAALVALLLAAAAVAVVLLLTRLSGGDGEEPAAAPTTSAPPRPSASRTTAEDATVFVDPDDYVGRDVEVVSEELRALGLRVRTEEVDNPGGEEPGEVTAVDPAGELEEGATVTVSHFGAQPEPEPEPDPEPTSEEPEPAETSAPGTTPPAPEEPPSSGPAEGSTQSGSTTGAPGATPTASPAARAPSEGDR